jgi:hypothetical protein
MRGSFLGELAAERRFEDGPPSPCPKLVAPAWEENFSPLGTMVLGFPGAAGQRCDSRPSRSLSEGRPQQAGFSGHRASSKRQTTKRLFSL